MLPNELLQKLATAYQGGASTQELEALEKELKTMPDGPAEAGYYRQLWDGFAALRSQQFREETSQWELEASTTDDEEIAEWYIAGELSPAQEGRLAQRQKTDPEFARIVTEQQQLQTGFAALKSENFREQIQHWEKDQPTGKVHQLRPPWFLPLAIAASFLLLLALGGNWYSQNNFSNTVLAGKYYKQVPTGNTLGAAAERETFLKEFDQAHQELTAERYAAAARGFEQLATQAPPASFSDEDLKYYQDNIDWNLIVARLGAGSTTGDFELRLNRITQDPSHTYYKQALALQQDLSSFWRW